MNTTKIFTAYFKTSINHSTLRALSSDFAPLRETVLAKAQRRKTEGAKENRES
jgi:hypothetical protein